MKQMSLNYNYAATGRERRRRLRLANLPDDYPINLYVRMPTKAVKQLDKLASNADMPLSSYIRDVLNEHLEEELGN